jgi:hypothetical protein
VNVGKIPGMVPANRDAIREAMYKDLGSHPNATTDLAKILGVAERAAYVISQIEKRTAVDSRDVDYQMYGVGKAEIRYQPKDVIENIVRKSSFFQAPYPPHYPTETRRDEGRDLRTYPPNYSIRQPRISN